MWWWLTFFLAAVIWNAFTLEVLTDDRSKKKKEKTKNLRCRECRTTERFNTPTSYATKKYQKHFVSQNCV